MLSCIPVFVLLARRLNRLEDSTLEEKDKRVKVCKVIIFCVVNTPSRQLMNEMLQGIKIVKYFAWEQKFLDLISSVRQRECGLLRSALAVHSVNDFVSQLIGVIGAVTTFSVFGMKLLATELQLYLLLLFFISTYWW